ETARAAPGGTHTMAERALRGTRLGATSYENDRNTDLAPRQEVMYDCTRGHQFSITFATEAEVPAEWECRYCGDRALRRDGQGEEPKATKPVRTHWTFPLSAGAWKNRRANRWTPGTVRTPMPSSAWKKKKLHADTLDG